MTCATCPRTRRRPAGMAAARGRPIGSCRHLVASGSRGSGRGRATTSQSRNAVRRPPGSQSPILRDRCPPSPCGRLPGLRLLRGLRPGPQPSANDAPTRRHAAGRAAPGWFPCCLAQIHQVRGPCSLLEWVPRLVQTTCTVPSRLPDRGRLAVPTRPRGPAVGSCLPSGHVATCGAVASSHGYG